MPGREDAFGLSDLPANPILLELEELKGYGVGIVRLQQFGSLGRKLGKPPLLALCLLETSAPLLRHLSPHIRLDLLHPLGLKLDGSVVIDDSLLELIDEDVTLAAAVALLAPAAEEIHVDAAVSSRPRDEKARAATATEDASLQVLGMFAFFLPSNMVSLQNRLDTVEELTADKRLVAPRVFNTGVGDDPDVIPVMQQV